MYDVGEMKEIISYWKKIVIETWMSISKKLRGRIVELAKFIMIFLLLPMLGGIGIINISLPIPLINNLRGEIQLAIIVITFDAINFFLRAIFITPPEIYHEQEEEINYLKRRLNSSEIDISLQPLSRENGEYVCLKVVNNNQDIPVLCKAIIKKMYWEREDPKTGNVWVSINTDEYGALSWLYGSNGQEGFKKVHIQPEFINIAKFEISRLILIDEGNLGKMIFAFLHKEKPLPVGKYKLQIDVICRIEDKYKTISWAGCIAMPNAGKHVSNWSELSIMVCEDVPK